MKFSMTQETIGPRKAKQMLDTITEDTMQRRIRPYVVENLTREMAENRWEFNGSPLRFSKDGELIDGQHRLQAVYNSGKSFKFLVLRGLDEDCIHTIDTGVAARKVSDVLYMRGETNTHTLAAAVKIILEVKRSKGKFYSGGGGRKISVKEIIDALSIHRKVRDSVHVVSKPFLKKIVRPGVAVALHYLFSRKNAEKAEEFFNQLDTGISNDGKTSAILLRDKLIRIKLTRVVNTTFIRKHFEIALVIKAWNYFIEGDMPKQLRFHPEKENFPKIA